MIKKLLKRNTMKHKQTSQPVSEQQDSFSLFLDDNIQTLCSIYENCYDIVFRRFMIGGKTKALLLYVDNLVDVKEIDDNVLSPLMQGSNEEEINNFNTLLEKKLSITEIHKLNNMTEVVEHVSLGNAIILINGNNWGFSLGLPHFEKRSIEEPLSEPVVQGPREGFTEALGINSSLLRRKIRSPHFKMEEIKTGRYTKTAVVLAYIEGITDKTLVMEAKNRLSRIDIDGVLESGYVEGFIEDNPFSPFPQLDVTERPEVVSAGLLEGRVAIIIDGTPSVLIAPATFFSLLQSSEDYSQRFIPATFIRWLRFLFLTMALLLPSLYVAILTFHQEMVPSTLLISFASSREGIPFPAFLEALLMEIMFEGLREAGLRLPKQIGAAVSIVGALVIGEAAVSAGIVSAPMVMVVAITGIASFLIPRYKLGFAIRVLRFPIMFLATLLGLVGVMLGVIIIITHLCTLRSFGTPYLSPLAPMKGRELKDVFLRSPWWSMNTRPHFTGNYNKYRQSPGMKPNPSGGDET